MSSKKRVWDDSYVKYGFTEVVENDEVKAQCMECGFIICNASLKPSKLNCHFLSIHDRKEMEIDMIKKKAWFDKKGTLSVLGFTPPKKPILEASYEVSQIIGKTRAPTMIQPIILGTYGLSVTTFF